MLTLIFALMPVVGLTAAATHYRQRALRAERELRLAHKHQLLLERRYEADLRRLGLDPVWMRHDETAAAALAKPCRGERNVA